MQRIWLYCKSGSKTQWLGQRFWIHCSNACKETCQQVTSRDISLDLSPGSFTHTGYAAFSLTGRVWEGCPFCTTRISTGHAWLRGILGDTLFKNLSVLISTNFYFFPYGFQFRRGTLEHRSNKLGYIQRLVKAQAFLPEITAQPQNTGLKPFKTTTITTNYSEFWKRIARILSLVYPWIPMLIYICVTGIM